MSSERDYAKDIAEIRSMMERSTKFLSLSGWAGVLAGIYALAGTYIASSYFSFQPDSISYPIRTTSENVMGLPPIIGLAIVILVMAIGTAIILSGQKAKAQDQTIWNPTSKRMIINMAYPLLSGGLLVLILIENGLSGLAAPLTMLFYGLSLISAALFTYKEVRSFGILMIMLGIISIYFIEYSLWLWGFGFGILHIIYGIYLHIKYER